MPFDSMPQGGSRGDPWARVCHSCKKPIGVNEPTEELRFDVDPERKLEEMNGTYHAACAKPLLSIKRALDMLSWRPS